MQLFRLYRNGVLFPALFILVFTIIYSTIFNFYSNDLSFNAIFKMTFFPALLFVLVMCFSSCTLFLNGIKSINRKLIFSLLTWFLLPFLYLLAIFMQDIQNRMKHNFGFGEDFFYLLFITMPFMFGLVMTFLHYRQSLNDGKGE